ncbi:DMT family transporter [Microlunatus soli]|uniref:DMT family transporter n=1 Tax=Microlunatus soli TaxID=630515 RepID=UPI00156097B1|nr:DMT family transporter [Microlunatus soli]
MGDAKEIEGRVTNDRPAAGIGPAGPSVAGPQAPRPDDHSPMALPTLLLGCLLVGASSTFIKLSGTTADTAAFFRCALALLVFAPIAVLEWRRYGRPHRRMVLFGLGSGVLLGADYLMWTQSILDAGAAVATVLIGIQVVVFPMLSRIFLGEQIQRRFLIALPVMIIGLGLTGGILDVDPNAPHPVRGAALGIAAGICYAGYLFAIRPASRPDRRMVVTPIAFGTASAAAVIGVVGGIGHGIDLHLDAHAWFWLIMVAICGQALSFVMIGYGSVRLAAGRAAAAMLLQPMAAIVLGTIVLDEHPAPSQYVGMAVTVAAVAMATIRGRIRTP